MNRVTISQGMLRWACERAGQSADSIVRRFPKFEQWERGEKQPTLKQLEDFARGRSPTAPKRLTGRSQRAANPRDSRRPVGPGSGGVRRPSPSTGEKQPTLKQLEDFAKVTRTPFGFLFLPEPPEERLPIPDLRGLTESETRRQRPVRPSPELLDTIYAMQRRQDWLREERIECEAEPLDFVGSAQLGDDPAAVGQELRRIIGVGDDWAADVATREEAVSDLRRRIEQLGIMAVINGVVGNNTHRELDVKEFRGFALTDP